MKGLSPLESLDDDESSSDPRDWLHSAMSSIKSSSVYKSESFAKCELRSTILSGNFIFFLWQQSTSFFNFRTWYSHRCFAVLFSPDEFDETIDPLPSSLLWHLEDWLSIMIGPFEEDSGKWTKLLFTLFAMIELEI